MALTRCIAGQKHSELNKAKVQGDYPVARGGLADVYRATLSDGSTVAVKCIRQFTDEKYVKHTARELSTWAKLKNDNILELFGLAIFRNCLAMVSPWMELGNVHHAIKINPNLDRYRLCKQLATVIKYLHEVENVIHGDIKGENILMASDGTLKLTDFGLAIMHDKTLQFSETDPGGGTARWMAPELYLDGARRCRETDIYAMGYVGKLPFHEIRGGGAIIKAVLDGRTPEVSELDQRPISPRAHIMIGTLHRCWRRDAKERATVAEVLGLLNLVGNV
ncbi:hypothetical protein FRC12_022921 [Ceratobasidium sp. 428]|nr:hypothetical protein FRC12_022921 [Ceratobasidium sp. 428]